ncbi:RNase MRP subunit [Teratosphaeriaceae sp. CCFEE 6253]|nr:RNase MRP subunit [Teratosphaeriaceae sp. CCFEE 6253]
MLACPPGEDAGSVGCRANITKDDLHKLEHQAAILHLFHHRNKNQHRRSVWWRHFSLFRKHLSKLVDHLSSLKEVPTTHLARTRKMAHDNQITIRTDQTLVLWRDVFVPKWQHAFSQIAADGRFAVLGLVLLAALAETCRILHVTAAFESLGQAEVDKVLEQFAEEGWEGRDDFIRPSTQASREDTGEVVVREATSGGQGALNRMDDGVGGAQRVVERAASTVESEGTKRSTSAKEGSARKKRRSRKGDAIDDLFSGLG